MAAPGFGVSGLRNPSTVSLFKLAMKGDWDNIVRQYNVDPACHFEKVTWLGDTALHMAVANGRQGVVKSLLEAICGISMGMEDLKLMEMEKGMQVVTGIDRFKNVLKLKNSDGNTPLHVAASMGSATMCQVILREDWYINSDPGSGAESYNAARPTPKMHINDLIGERNNAGETPLFLAVHMGHTNAFLFLTEICGHRETKAAYKYCRKDDGKTILHAAISGQYSDLAFQIICLYENLVESATRDGETPLQALARKPSAFRSGSKLGPWENLIYECISANELKADISHTKNKSSRKDVIKENRYTWSTCLQFMRNVILLVNPKARASRRPKADPESPMENDAGKQSARGGAQSALWSRLVKQIPMPMLIVLGMGAGRVNRIKQQKEKHTWSVRVMHKLIEKSTTMYVYDKPGECFEEADNEIFKIGEFLEEKGKSPSGTGAAKETAAARNGIKEAAKDKSPSGTRAAKDTAILIAARNGIEEIVEAILREFPVAIYDLDAEKKNVVLLAVETRQISLYKMLLNSPSSRNVPSPSNHSQPSDSNFHQEDDQKPASLLVNDNAFRMVDLHGNSALHLAAKLPEVHKPWPIPGAALQMQWEIKWRKFVEKSIPPNFFVRYNEMGKTPEDIFTESHKDLVKDGGEWLKNTSESCSVVAALIATVAFATSTAIPGGTNDQNGKPTLENQFAFKMFGITSLVSLCFSVTSMSMFLSILTSTYEEKAFGRSLPWKLLLGLTSLFVSIASVLVSFCSGHFFVLGDTLKYAAFPVYAVTCLPITFFAAAQFPLYFALIRATFRSPFGGSNRRKQKLDDEAKVEKALLEEVLQKLEPASDHEIETSIPLPLGF